MALWRVRSAMSDMLLPCIRPREFRRHVTSRGREISFVRLTPRIVSRRCSSSPFSAWLSTPILSAVSPESANRLQSIAPSPTLEVGARSRALAATGVDVFAFGVGEPDFEPALYILDG